MAKSGVQVRACSSNPVWVQNRFMASASGKGPPVGWSSLAHTLKSHRTVIFFLGTLFLFTSSWTVSNGKWSCWLSMAPVYNQVNWQRNQVIIIFRTDGNRGSESRRMSSSPLGPWDQWRERKLKRREKQRLKQWKSQYLNRSHLNENVSPQSQRDVSR